MYIQFRVNLIQFRVNLIQFRVNLIREKTCFLALSPPSPLLSPHHGGKPREGRDQPATAAAGETPSPCPTTWCQVVGRGQYGQPAAASAAAAEGPHHRPPTWEQVVGDGRGPAAAAAVHAAAVHTQPPLHLTPRLARSRSIQRVCGGGAVGFTLF